MPFLFAPIFLELTTLKIIIKLSFNIFLTQLPFSLRLVNGTKINVELGLKNAQVQPSLVLTFFQMLNK